MNKRMVAYFVGRVLRIEAMLMLLPVLVSVLYREDEWIYLAGAVALSFFVGYLFYHEALTWNKLVGVGICLVGLVFINLK